MPFYCRLAQKPDREGIRMSAIDVFFVMLLLDLENL